MTGKTLIITTMFVALGIANVFLNNSVVAKGKELEGLRVQKADLELQLREIENQIAQASSLNTIRESAIKMGMVAGKLYFLPPVPVALAPRH